MFMFLYYNCAAIIIVTNYLKFSTLVNNTVHLIQQENSVVVNFAFSDLLA
jgi:hypothetical protein